MSIPLILASTSPRRQRLLHSMGVEPIKICDPAIDESPLRGEKPWQLAHRLALQKAQAVVSDFSESALILAGDTVVACRGRLLDKADSDEQVFESLRIISGRRVQIYTSIAVIEVRAREIVREKVCDVKSWVKCKCLTIEDVTDYVASKQGIGVAGACSIEGRGGLFFSKVYGSYSGIIGLPLYETGLLLTQFGYFS